MIIRELPPQEERVETGVVRFQGDWPGIFIRGDNAFFLAGCIKQALEANPEMYFPTKMGLEGFLFILQSCILDNQSEEENV